MANIFTDYLPMWVGTASSAVGGGIGYFLSSKKRKSEEKQTEGIDTATWGNGTDETPTVTSKTNTTPFDVGAYID